MGDLDDEASVIISGIWSGFLVVVTPLLAIFLGATIGVAGTLVVDRSLNLPLVGNPFLIVIIVPVTMLFDLFGGLLFLVLFISSIAYWRSEERKSEIFFLIVFICWLHVFRYAVTRSNIPLSCLAAVVSLVIIAGLYVSIRFGPYWWLLLRDWISEARADLMEDESDDDADEDEDRFKTIDLTVEDPPPAPPEQDDGPFPPIE